MDLKEALQILKLDACGSETELKAAFYRLAHDFHPDKNPLPESQQTFRQIVAAYEFCVENLDALRSQAGAKAAFAPKIATDKIFESSEQVFADLFGYSTAGRILGFQKPFELRLSLTELLHPVPQSRKVMAYEQCASCAGGGQTAGPKARLCRYCFGQGRITVDLPQAISQKICPKCHGRGREIAEPCARCDGFGRTPVWCRATFCLPRGLRVGASLAFEVTDERRGKPVELFLQIELKPDGIFRIENPDLICDYPIDFARADFWQRDYALQTPDGEKSFRLTAHGKPGDRKIFRGLGLYHGNGSEARGDLVVIFTRQPGFWQKWVRRMFS